MQAGRLAGKNSQSNEFLRCSKRKILGRVWRNIFIDNHLTWHYYKLREEWTPYQDKLQHELKSKTFYYYPFPSSWQPPQQTLT